MSRDVVKDCGGWQFSLRILMSDNGCVDCGKLY